MSRRAAAADQTRRRIVEATAEVHAEQGIAAARLDDIARRAGVSLGTVYRHFGRYEDLVYACGRLTFERTPPPAAADAAAAMSGAADERDRLRRLVDELLGFYEATGPLLEGMRHDRAALAPVDEALQAVESGIAAWVDAAVDGSADRALVATLVDHRTWSAMVEHRVPDPRAATLRLLEAALAPRDAAE